MWAWTETLFADATSRDLAAGETLFRAGDAVTSMTLLLHGQIDLQRHTPQGVRMILHRAGAGQILAEASAWSDTYHCDAVAICACRVATLPRPVFLSRLRAAPDLLEHLTRELARSLQSGRQQAELRALPKVADRLDAWLALGNELPQKGRWQDLAAELGVTREAFYRELSRRRRLDRRATPPRHSPSHPPDSPL